MTNGGFYFVNQLGRLLDARPGRRPHVQSKRACVHRGKEILPEKGNEQPGGNAKREKSNSEGRSVSQHGA